MIKITHLTFVERINMFGEKVIEFDNDKKETIGHFEKLRVGAWMSWVYFLHPDCYLSASCSDEVREKQRQLNSKLRTKQTEGDKDYNDNGR